MKLREIPFFIYHVKFVLSVLSLVLIFVTKNAVVPGVLLYCVWAFEILQFFFPAKILSWTYGGDVSINMFTIRLAAIVALLNIIVIVLSQFGIIGPVWLKVAAIETVVINLFIEFNIFMR